MKVFMVKRCDGEKRSYEVWKSAGVVTEKVHDGLAYHEALHACVWLKLKLGIPTAPVKLEDHTAKDQRRAASARYGRKVRVGSGCRAGGSLRVQVAMSLPR